MYRISTPACEVVMNVNIINPSTSSQSKGGGVYMTTPLKVILGSMFQLQICFSHVGT